MAAGGALAIRIEARDPDEFGVDLGLLAGFIARVGPLAFVQLTMTGPASSRSAEILEVGIVLVDPGEASVRCGEALLRTRRPLPPFIVRVTGLRDSDVAEGPSLAEIVPTLREALTGRTLIAQDVESVTAFLGRDVDPGLAKAETLDLQDLFALTHPDASDLRLETQTRAYFDRSESQRAPGATRDVLAIIAAAAEAAIGGRAPRFATARAALLRYSPKSSWLALLEAPRGLRPPSNDEGFGDTGFVPIDETAEAPVPFDEEAIADVLRDEARGRRYFPGYVVREEQIELARRFVRVLRDGGMLLLEGGTGVGKSLAYLAAAIPFAMERAEAGEREPVVLSTRTKLLQDQLLEKDIAAAARLLGYPELKALSIKGRANYICEQRLGHVLAEGAEESLFPEEQRAYGVLQACARTRSHGEVGTLPGALLRRNPPLRDLVRRSVAYRAEQCSREACAHERRCPFGLRRKALAKADLIVANHDLLLRWPPDYPRFSHVITDEGHELAGVADEVYARTVRPDEIRERLDEIFGGPQRLVAAKRREPTLLSPKLIAPHEKAIRDARRNLSLDLTSLGRSVSQRASEYGEFQLPAYADQLFPEAADLSDIAATRLEGLANLAGRLDAEAAAIRAATRDADDEDDGPSAVGVSVEALREAAANLRLAFSADAEEVVAAFENLISPYDHWSLVLRLVSPAEDFHLRFLDRLESFSVVSASLFVAGDPYAALGDLDLEIYPGLRSDRIAVGSPFPYEKNMRVAAITGVEDVVEETAQVLALLARQLGGRCLGLFTSLRRMRSVGDRLEALLAGEGTEVLVPRRASDDPAALVERFRASRGGAVLLGARRFWQGIDIRGDDLQAVVIEKLPFEVPNELRRRREERIRQRGENPFERATLGHMLLHLKQMSGRLIRSEVDRDLVVIVDARTDKRYFQRLEDAFPPG